MDNKIVAGSRAEVSEAGFISKVFLWMALGLGLSGLGSFGLLSQPELLKTVFTNPAILIGLVVAELGLVIWLSAAAMRMSASMAAFLFAVY